MSRLARSSVTPDLSETIQVIIDSVLMNLNVCLPAKIVSYDSSTQFAEVQPQLMKRYETGGLVKLPVISDVPVKHPRAAGGKAFVHMPIEVGDDVVLIFSHRSLENWKTQGGLTDPNDRRKFHISDAFALLGGSALPDAFDVEDPTAIQIVNDKAEVRLVPSGKFKIQKVSGDELFDLLSQFADAASQISNSAGPIFNLAAFTALKAKFDALKG